MPLLNLPNDLLYCVSDHLERERDINAFAQANRRLYRLLDPYLYRHNIHRSRSSALLWAAKHGQEATVQKLLREQSGGEAMSDFFANPLCEAAKLGHKGIVKLLLDKGANVNAENDYWGGALNAAANRGHEQIVQLLLDNGANINVEGRHHNNAAESALAGGHQQIAQLLIRNGANTDTLEELTPGIFSRRPWDDYEATPR